ncbi:hypothetical protein Tco_0271037 [Tanacetum coccineum]
MTAAIKHMVANFSKLEKFERVDFRRWQKKMHFFLSAMSVVYVLNTPILDGEDDARVEQIRRRNRWENGDHMCRAIILNVTTGIPTSRVTCEFEPREMHRHITIELDYPLLETAEDIRCSKVRIVEALDCEPLQKGPAHRDVQYIVIYAPLYRF